MTTLRRVTYLITSSGVAGAEKQVHDMAVAMHRRGWQVHAISMLPLDAAFDDLPELGIPTSTLGMRQGAPDPRALWRLRELLQSQRPDVLHAHMVHANLLARAARLTCRVPVVISTMHNQNQGARWRTLAYRLTDRLSDYNTTVSQIALDDAVRNHIAPKARLTLIPNGIDTAPYVEDATARDHIRRELSVGKEFLWLAVGRLSAAKDYPNMLAAFDRVMQVAPATRLVIAGVGPLEVSLAARISQLRLGEQVELLGLRSDVPSLMQAADGFVMSSAWEGLPMVLLEAAASRLPIVATDVGGSREAIVDGHSGYVVPRADASALADAMARVMALSPGARDQMGDAGHAHVAGTFDMDAVADRWDAAYRQLLAQRGR